MILSAALTLTLLPAAAIAQDHVIDETQDPQFLYVLSGASGSVAGHVLTLDGVPGVIYFSDRPARIAGHLDALTFTELWSEEPGGFGNVPPNAVLSMLDDGIEDVVIELLDVSSEGDRLVFDVEVLEGALPEGSIGPASLFIDSSAPTSVSCNTTANGWNLNGVENLVPVAGYQGGSSYLALSCTDINAIAAQSWNGSTWNSAVQHDGYTYGCSGSPPFGGLLSGDCELMTWNTSTVSLPGNISVTGTK